MHELSLCQSLIRLIEDQLRQERGALRVTEVALEIGAAAAIDPEALRFAFPIAARGTPAEGAALSISEVPLRLRCTACGHIYAPEPGPMALSAPCPDCGAVMPELHSGDGLTLSQIRVDDGH